MREAIETKCAALLPQLEASADRFAEALAATREICAAPPATEALQLQAAMTLGFIEAMLEMLL